MTGHLPFSDLTKDFPPERRVRIAAKAVQLREAMTLEELRKACDLSQEEVAAALTVGQPAVAKLEKRADMHVSNLRLYIKALGSWKSPRTSGTPAWSSATSRAIGGAVTALRLQDECPARLPFLFFNII